MFGSLVRGLGMSGYYSCYYCCSYCCYCYHYEYYIVSLLQSLDGGNHAPTYVPYTCGIEAHWGSDLVQHLSFHPRARHILCVKTAQTPSAVSTPKDGYQQCENVRRQRYIPAAWNGLTSTGKLRLQRLVAASRSCG